jgi:hypothetical protein
MQKGAVSTIVIAALVLFAVPLIASSPKSADAVVTYLDGTALAVAPGAQKGVPLKKDDRIAKDQEVRVGERSRLELRFPDGTVMRLAEKSNLTLNDALYRKKSGEKNIRVNLGVGRLWANVKKLMTPDSKVEVRTLNAVAGVRGTVYRVNVEEDTSAVVKVYDGAVAVAGTPREVPKPATEVSGPVPVPGPHAVPAPYHEVTMEQWHEIVKSMQQITISPQGVASKPQDFNAQEDAADEWVRWNQERDRAVAF